MQIIEGKLVLGKQNCNCRDGTRCGERRCPICEGTGKGKRGKVSGCKNCYGSGKTIDTKNRIVCSVCNGSYVNFRNETMYDDIPMVIWNELKFIVYRKKREMSGNEMFLGIGCVYSCNDYGQAWAKPDEWVIESVKSHRAGPAQDIVNEDGTFCDHVGIFITPEGYSVRCVFDLAVVEAIISIERPLSEYMVIGSEISNRGRNGTLEALYELE